MNKSESNRYKSQLQHLCNGWTVELTFQKSPKRMEYTEQNRRIKKNKDDDNWH